MVLQGEQAEDIVARVKAEEKESQNRKSRCDTLQIHLLNREEETLITKVESPSKPKPERGGNSSGQVRTNKQYSFRDEHVVSFFKLLKKSNKLKLPEAKRPEEGQDIRLQLLLVLLDAKTSHEELLHLQGCSPDFN